MTRTQAQNIRNVIEQAVQFLPDETAINAASLYPAWESDAAYHAGQRVRYNGTLYKCLTAHTSQDDWTPDAAPSLWAKVLIPDETVIPAWEQPGATNAYMQGDKVAHNGKTWVSDVDNNVWMPGVFGWTQTES